MSQLADRVAVVTGGGRGIGAEIARDLAALGAKVMIAGRTENVLADVAKEITDAGGVAHHSVCDVAKPDDVLRLLEDTHQELGPATIVVNNAGIARSAKLSDTDEAMWAEIMNVNLTGAYRVTRAFLGDVVAAKKNGRIINIASVAAKIGFSFTSAYCASKHGLLGFSRALAHELARKGPTVNCVCPGWVDTAMVSRAVSNIVQATQRSADQARGELEAMSPQGRMMTTAEVSKLVCFVASDAAAGITGQGLNVDGGAVMS